MTRALGGLLVTGIVVCLAAIVLQGCVPLPPSLPLPVPSAAKDAAPATGLRLEVECATCGDLDLKLGPGSGTDAAETPAAETPAAGTPTPETTPAVSERDAPDTREAPHAESEAAPPAPEARTELPPFCPADTTCLLTGPLFGAMTAGEFNEVQCINHPNSIGCDQFKPPK